MLEGCFMKRSMLVSLLTFVSLMMAFIASSPSFAMEDEDSNLTGNSSIKNKGFSDLLDSALGGNEEDDKFIRKLLPLTHDLGKWISPEKALELIKQKNTSKNHKAEMYEKALSQVVHEVTTFSGVKEVLEAIDLFKDAHQRGYGPALINLGEIYLRLFQFEKIRVGQHNIQLRLDAFSEFIPPVNRIENSKNLEQALDCGTRALHYAKSPLEFDDAAHIIVNALKGTFAKHDESCTDTKQLNAYYFMLRYHIEDLQKNYVDKFEKKAGVLESQNPESNAKIIFYNESLPKLKKFIGEYPLFVSNPFLYLPRPNSIHPCWGEMKGEYCEVNKIGLCLTTPLKEIPQIFVVSNLADHYREKANQKKKETRFSQQVLNSRKKAEKLQKLIDFNNNIQRKKISALQSTIPVFEQLWNKYQY